KSPKYIIPKIENLYFKAYFTTESFSLQEVGGLFSRNPVNPGIKKRTNSEYFSLFTVRSSRFFYTSDFFQSVN
ncbi:MAG: hypothetical protein ACI4UF_00620, partial [Thermoguttaceae bacterium]